MVKGSECSRIIARPQEASLALALTGGGVVARGGPVRVPVPLLRGLASALVVEEPATTVNWILVMTATVVSRKRLACIRPGRDAGPL